MAGYDKDETALRRDSLSPLNVQRRTLRSHPAFRFGTVGRQVRLVPDGMFLFRSAGGVMCCFVEVDTGSMSMRQMGEKLRRYECWMRSYEAEKHLKNLYRQHGAEDPQPQFRLLIVATDADRRSDQLFGTAFVQTDKLLRKLWIVSLADFRRFKRPLETCGWKKAGGSQSALFPRIGTPSATST